jgi:hypothetical protein
MSQECPTCGDEFTNTTGMKTHHAQVHGESLAGFEKECKNCGDTFVAPQRSREYCEQSCVGKDLFNGEDNPCYRGGRFPEIECEWCGDTFEVHASQVDDKRFCSMECFGKQQQTVTGEDHPAFKSKTVECAHCGSDFHKQPNQIEYTEKHFCDRECFGNYQSEHVVGEAHPSWKGGHSEDYGDNWQNQREKCIRRDGECRDCGISREQHIETFGADLHAHHVIPKRKFESLEAANDLGNLVTLCQKCHPKWEGVPVAPQ